MNDFNAFVSPEYPVLHSVALADDGEPDGGERCAEISVGLLVKGIPSFLATIPVDQIDVPGLTDSLEGGNVRVAVVGMSVDGSDLPREAEPSTEPWVGDPPEPRELSAAFLSLVCADGRRIGIARIVAREGSASPEDVARFVLRQIARGVQIPDLASTS